LWQALTGRTPDGVTLFALNSPTHADLLLDRSLWPKPYPEAVDLVLTTMCASPGPGPCKRWLGPTIVSAASTGQLDLLKRLLLYSLGDASLLCMAEDEVSMVRIAAGGHLPCCKLVFERIAPFGSRCVRYSPVSQALLDRAAACDMPLIEVFLSNYAVDEESLKDAIVAAAKSDLAEEADLTILMLLEQPELTQPAPDTVAKLFTDAAVVNRPRVLERLLGMSLLLDGVRNAPRNLLQPYLDRALQQAVVAVQVELIRMFLQHGACVRADADYSIYLAAVSGRADVMELLLNAADVDAECAAQYRQQMHEPAGLLGVAQMLWHTNMLSWGDPQALVLFSDESVDAISAALHGRHAAAVEWLLTPPTRCRLDDADAIVAALNAGDTDLIHLLLHPRSVGTLRDASVGWSSIMRRALGAVQDAPNFELFPLLFDQSFPSGVSLEDISDAIWSKHPRMIKYALDGTRDSIPYYEIFFDLCMMGDRQMLEHAWRSFLRCDTGRSNANKYLRPYLCQAFQLCTNDDLTPMVMALAALMTGCGRLTFFVNSSKHRLLLAAMYGNMPCVKLLLAHGACPRLALPLAVKHQQHEVAAYLTHVLMTLNARNDL